MLQLFRWYFPFSLVTILCSWSGYVSKNIMFRLKMTGDVPRSRYKHHFFFQYKQMVRLPVQNQFCVVATNTAIVPQSPWNYPVVTRLHILSLSFCTKCCTIEIFQSRPKVLDQLRNRQTNISIKWAVLLVWLRTNVWHCCDVIKEVQRNIILKTGHGHVSIPSCMFLVRYDRC